MSLHYFCGQAIEAGDVDLYPVMETLIQHCIVI